MNVCERLCNISYSLDCKYFTVRKPILNKKELIILMLRCSGVSRNDPKPNSAL